MFQELAMLGIMSIIPAIIAISIAFIAKNVYVSLGSGLISGIIILNLREGSNIIQAVFGSIINFPVYLINSLGDSWNAGIVMQVLLIGGLVSIITYNGGLRALALSLGKFAKGEKSAQFITWIMGIIIFFDDYANALIVGPSMKSITDDNNVSREKLSFIIDATAAPIAGLALISTWIGYELSLIDEQISSLGIEGISSIQLFIESLPYRFYNILMLIFIILTIFMSREFGGMLTAQRRAKKGEVKKSSMVKMNEFTEENAENTNGYKAKAYEGYLPIIVLIISSIVLFITNGYHAIIISDDITRVMESALNNPFKLSSIAIAFSNADASVVLAQAAVLAILVALITSSIRGAFTIKKGTSIMFDGIMKLIPTVVVLLFAWSLGSIMGDEGLSTGTFLATALGETIPAFLIPAIIFALAALMAFATGTSYGTMGILFPLAVPLAWTAGTSANAMTMGNSEIDMLVMSIGAILTGVIVGDHCSPISDTTILSSAGADVDHLDHVQTQIPYAFTVAIISFIGYILVGINVPVFIVLLLSIISLVGVLFLIGKKV